VRPLQRLSLSSFSLLLRTKSRNTSHYCMQLHEVIARFQLGLKMFGSSSMKCLTCSINDMSVDDGSFRPKDWCTRRLGTELDIIGINASHPCEVSQYSYHAAHSSFSQSGPTVHRLWDRNFPSFAESFWSISAVPHALPTAPPR
jgi:hypothetical protein